MSGAQLALFNLPTGRRAAPGEPPVAVSDTESAAPRDVVATGPLRNHPRGPLVLSQVRYVRRFFPELDGLVLTIGLTRSAAGFAEIEGQKLWLNPRRLALHTIAHELVHLLQGRGLVPGGERSCDLFALARDVSLVDAFPFYLKLPARLADPSGLGLRPGVAASLHQLAAAAIARRSAGERRYIAWFEHQAESIRPASRRFTWPTGLWNRLLLK